MMEAVEKALPFGSALEAGETEVDNLLLAVGAQAQGHRGRALLLIRSGTGQRDAAENRPRSEAGPLPAMGWKSPNRPLRRPETRGNLRPYWGKKNIGSVGAFALQEIPHSAHASWRTSAGQCESAICVWGRTGRSSALAIQIAGPRRELQGRSRARLAKESPEQWRYSESPTVRIVGGQWATLIPPALWSTTFCVEARRWPTDRLSAGSSYRSPGGTHSRTTQVPPTHEIPGPYSFGPTRAPQAPVNPATRREATVLPTPFLCMCTPISPVESLSGGSDESQFKLLTTTSSSSQRSTLACRRASVS